MQRPSQQCLFQVRPVAWALRRLEHEASRNITPGQPLCLWDDCFPVPGLVFTRAPSAWEIRGNPCACPVTMCIAWPASGPGWTLDRCSVPTAEQPCQMTSLQPFLRSTGKAPSQSTPLVSYITFRNVITASSSLTVKLPAEGFGRATGSHVLSLKVCGLLVWPGCLCDYFSFPPPNRGVF